MGVCAGAAGAGAVGAEAEVGSTQGVFYAACSNRRILELDSTGRRVSLGGRWWGVKSGRVSFHRDVLGDERRRKGHMQKCCLGGKAPDVAVNPRIIGVLSSRGKSFKILGKNRTRNHFTIFQYTTTPKGAMLFGSGFM